MSTRSLVKFAPELRQRIQFEINFFKPGCAHVDVYMLAVFLGYDYKLESCRVSFQLTAVQYIVLCDILEAAQNLCSGLAEVTMVIQQTCALLALHLQVTAPYHLK